MGSQDRSGSVPQLTERKWGASVYSRSNLFSKVVGNIMKERLPDFVLVLEKDIASKTRRQNQK